MGRHRRSKLALGARSTVVKAAAAMGVATALAAGINSAANGPIGTQAAADTTGDPVNLAGNSAPDTGHHTGGTTATHESVPTGFATESATAPKLIQPASDIHQNTPGSAAVHAVQQATTPSSTATEAPVPSASTAPSAPSTAPSTPAQPPASQAPAPAQGGSTGGDGSTSGGTQSHPVGSLLGGVVGTVGGVVDGLLG